MYRFWVSWFAELTDRNAHTPYQYWVTGERMEDGKASICALILSIDEDTIWKVIRMHFPDCEQRFCDKKPKGWVPPEDRFPAFENRIEIGRTVKPVPVG